MFVRQLVCACTTDVRVVPSLFSQHIPCQLSRWDVHYEPTPAACDDTHRAHTGNHRLCPCEYTYKPDSVRDSVKALLSSECVRLLLYTVYVCVCRRGLFGFAYICVYMYIVTCAIANYFKGEAVFSDRLYEWCIPLYVRLTQMLPFRDDLMCVHVCVCFLGWWIFVYCIQHKCLLMGFMLTNTMDAESDKKMYEA